jgi:hypothetical protein
MFASGRFAMLDDGMLWRPVLEKHLGQTVAEWHAATACRGSSDDKRG